VSLPDAKLLALAANWLTQARTLIHGALESSDARDIHRLAGMASSLNFAARELLCWAADFEASDRPSVANTEVDRAHVETDIQLADDAKQQQP
jgi:hypothetical protein